MSSPPAPHLHHPSHSQSSLPSSPAPSPPEDHERVLTTDISLETLVSHLLASKRSLSSVTTVWRANEIVKSARLCLEESVILSSRTDFLRKGISHQARILRKVHNGIEHVHKDGQRDFQNVIRSLDAADIRLQKTMDVLRMTIVESAFRPANEEPRSLLDFVDEASVETMRTQLKESIDQAQASQAEFLDSIRAYEADLHNMKSAMTTKTTASSREHLDSPIPHLLHSMEEHAAEMASLLESLVHHFDVCVSAIKHTEGGFAAVKQAASNNELPEGVTVSGVIQEHDDDAEAQLEPLSEEERLEMLAVLANDAAEVDDVVQELHQRLAEMEGQLEQIKDHVSSLAAAYDATTAAFHLLEGISARLPVYIASSQDFQVRWADGKALIGEQMEELESLREFYEGYLSCYDGLIVEVARRRAEEEKMKNILRKAMEQVRKLHKEDSKERAAFRRDVGDYMPSDLWPGMMADAPRFEISILGQGGPGNGDAPEDQLGGGVGNEESVSLSTPELSKDVVEAAIMRERDRERHK